MRIDVRRAFPDGPPPIVGPLAWIAFIAVTVVLFDVIPSWVQRAIGGLYFFGLGCVTVLALTNYFVAQPARRKLISGPVFALWPWFPPLWVAYCTYRGTGSWLWALVAVVVGAALWDFVTYLLRRLVPRPAASRSALPSRTRKSRRHAARSTVQDR